MKTILIPLADGCEDIEALTPIDLLRRAGYKVLVAGDKPVINTSHAVKIIPDLLIEDISKDIIFDAIVLPGGSKGTDNLMQNDRIKYFLKVHKRKGMLIAAICAAPTILANFEILEKGCKITSYPSFKEELEINYDYREDNVVCDDNIITSRGAGTAIEFSLAIIKYLSGEDEMNKVAKSICYK